MNLKQDTLAELTCDLCYTVYTEFSGVDPLWYGTCLDEYGKVICTSSECANDIYPDVDSDTIKLFVCDKCSGEHMEYEEMIDYLSGDEDIDILPAVYKAIEMTNLTKRMDI